MGEILLESGVSKKIYNSLSGIFKRIPGGLLHTNIAVCTVFGAISGSSLSTAAAVGSVAYPELSKRKYDDSMVVGSLAGGGTLGLLIPPSLSLLIYGALTETSIGKLFLGGIVPGILLSWLCVHFFVPYYLGWTIQFFYPQKWIVLMVCLMPLSAIGASGLSLLFLFKSNEPKKRRRHA